MKVKNFVNILDSFGEEITPNPVLIDKGGRSYGVSAVNYSRNSVVSLVACSSEGLTYQEFDKLVTRVRILRPNATIVVDIGDEYHVSDILNQDSIIIIAGGKAKK